MRYAIAITLITFSIVFLLQKDYEDETASELYYCKMVKSKAWPNYDPLINCKEILK
jgi:hypothetical protein